MIRVTAIAPRAPAALRPGYARMTILGSRVMVEHAGGCDWFGSILDAVAFCRVRGYEIVP